MGLDDRKIEAWGTTCHCVLVTDLVTKTEYVDTEELIIRYKQCFNKDFYFVASDIGLVLPLEMKEITPGGKERLRR